MVGNDLHKMKWFKRKKIKEGLVITPSKFQEKEIIHFPDVNWEKEIDNVKNIMAENNYEFIRTLSLYYPMYKYKNKIISVETTILIFKDLMQ